MRRRGFLKGLGAAGSTLAAAPLLASATARAAARSAAGLALLKRWPGALQARVARYNQGHLAKEAKVALGPTAPARAELDGAVWTCALRAAPVKNQGDATALWATFRLAKGTAAGASVGVALTLADWSRDEYLLLPGACYDGNRFESRRIAYPPLLSEPADIGPGVPTIISDIPRLDIHAGPSRVDLLAGDLATPAVAVWSRRARMALIWLTDQTTPAGDVGVCVEESDGQRDGDADADAAAGGGASSRRVATLLLTTPGVRDGHRYALGNTRAPSRDQGTTFVQGAEVVLRMRLYVFPCPELQGLFDRFIAVRKDLSGPTRLRHALPFSSAAKLHEEKYNRENWVERPGYYATSLGDGAGPPPPSWQTGWGGGLVATHALLFSGDPLTRDRVLRTYDFVFDKGQARSGFFHAASDGQSWFDEGSGAAARGGAPVIAKQAKSWHLVRRSGEVLYFMLKQLALLERQDASFRARESWTAGLLASAETFVALWDRHHQLGQFVHADTGQLIVGGSTAGAIVPAALALASRHFKNEDHLRVAVATGEWFHHRFVRAGLTTGGVADALQCPDSESAAGLLESFVVLYETTGDRIWVERASEIAHQLASWQISYDFRFPLATTFARLDIQTTGAMIGNAQNKHGVPGFPLYSGDALLKLYRATGKTLYLEMLRDTAHNQTQYLNRGDHRLHEKSAPGWMCARVSTTDAVDAVGETAAGGSPLEICGMLTAAEVPGLYVHPDTAFVFAFDHVDVRVKEKTARHLVLSLANPTPFEAAVRVLAENERERDKPLGPSALWGARVVTVAPGATEELELARGEA